MSGRAYCSQATTGRIRSNWLCSQWRFERRPVAFGTVEWLVQHSWRLLSHGLRRAQIQLNFTTSEPCRRDFAQDHRVGKPRAASLEPPRHKPTQRSAARSAPAKAWAVRPTVEHWGTRLLLEFHSPDLAVEPPTTAVRDGEHEAPCRSAGTLLLRARRYGPGKWIEGTGYTHTPAMLQRLTSLVPLLIRR